MTTKPEPPVQRFKPTSATADQHWEELSQHLSDPFRVWRVKFRPGTIRGDRAQALAYIDARDTMRRLDEACGPGNWQTRFGPYLSGVGVSCTLSIRLPGSADWVERTDAGCISEQKDPGDQYKAAHSDALKRAGAQWGVGRYLYDLDDMAGYDSWVPCRDRKLIEVPTLPHEARPKPVDPQTLAEVIELFGRCPGYLQDKMVQEMGIDRRKNGEPILSQWPGRLWPRYRDRIRQFLARSAEAAALAKINQMATATEPKN